MTVNTSWSGERHGFPAAVRKAAMTRDRRICQVDGPYCLVEASEVDHIIPVAEGGTDDVTNAQAVCRPCHKAKTKLERARGRLRAKGRR